MAMLGKLNDIFGTAGLRLISKIVLIVAGLSLLTIKADILVDLLNKTYGMDFLVGTNILGALVLFIVLMMHKGNI